MTDEFYVGYLPVPAGQRRFLVVLLPLVILAALAAGVVLSSAQNDPGDGAWNLAEPVTLSGRLATKPYPMLVVGDESEKTGRAVLLVTMGKIGGIGEPITINDSPAVATITGYPIGRDPTVLLTIEDATRDVEQWHLLVTVGRERAQRGFRNEPESLGSATLEGEVIDPKCYFGAMKPGHGKVHKACAALCIRGGIPPMFKTHDASGDPTYYLLVDSKGRGLTGEKLDKLLPYVADPVRIEGEIERQGHLLTFKIDPEKVERILDF